ncbi:MAG TPA: hypothetical protein PKK54_01370 [bacterium]|nr:hypothetical protein [bacterium]
MSFEKSVLIIGSILIITEIFLLSFSLYLYVHLATENIIQTPLPSMYLIK